MGISEHHQTLLDAIAAAERDGHLKGYRAGQESMRERARALLTKEQI